MLLRSAAAMLCLTAMPALTGPIQRSKASAPSADLVSRSTVVPIPETVLKDLSGYDPAYGWLTSDTVWFHREYDSLGTFETIEIALGRVSRYERLNGRWKEFEYGPRAGNHLYNVTVSADARWIAATIGGITGPPDGVLAATTDGHTWVINPGPRELFGPFPYTWTGRQAKLVIIGGRGIVFWDPRHPDSYMDVESPDRSEWSPDSRFQPSSFLEDRVCVSQVAKGMSTHRLLFVDASRKKLVCETCSVAIPAGFEFREAAQSPDGLRIAWLLTHRTFDPGKKYEVFTQSLWVTDSKCSHWRQLGEFPIVTDDMGIGYDATGLRWTRRGDHLTYLFYPHTLYSLPVNTRR